MEQATWDLDGLGPIVDAAAEFVANTTYHGRKLVVNGSDVKILLLALLRGALSREQVGPVKRRVVPNHCS
jgi:hypothetical protein